MRDNKPETVGPHFDLGSLPPFTMECVMRCVVSRWHVNVISDTLKRFQFWVAKTDTKLRPGESLSSSEMCFCIELKDLVLQVQTNSDSGLLALNCPGSSFTAA